MKTFTQFVNEKMSTRDKTTLTKEIVKDIKKEKNLGKMSDDDIIDFFLPYLDNFPGGELANDGDIKDILKLVKSAL